MAFNFLLFLVIIISYFFIFVYLFHPKLSTLKQKWIKILFHQKLLWKKSGSISDNGKTNEENASKPQVKQTSTHYTPKLITSLDCKILQYQYNIYKLEKSISHIRKLKLNVRIT